MPQYMIYVYPQGKLHDLLNHDIKAFWKLLYKEKSFKSHCLVKLVQHLMLYSLQQNDWKSEIR